MKKYNYFFGSDERSVPYLTVIHENHKPIKVVTTQPNQKGRGKKHTIKKTGFRRINYCCFSTNCKKNVTHKINEINVC